MSLTKEEALRAYAKVWNNLDIGNFPDILADDFHYAIDAGAEEIPEKPPCIPAVKESVGCV
jgi:hypothetical protein